MDIKMNPIGYIYTPFESVENMPIQPAGAEGVEGRLVVKPEYVEGLADIEEFSHIMLLYYLHQIKDPQLTVVPFLDNQPHGIFATRSPKRPNQIGISVVKLTRVEQDTLYIKNIDVLNETPVLDIKPYFIDFDHHDACRFGWYEKAMGKVKEARSDKRFK